MKILFFPRAELLVRTPEYINATRMEISYRHHSVINFINYYYSMKNKNLPRTGSSQTQSSSSETHSNTPRVFRRRSFLKGLGITGATFLSANALLITEGKAQATLGGGKLTKGDVAILRLLAPAEIIDADLWQQYNKISGAGAAGSISQPYIPARETLHGDMPQN